MSSVVAGRRVVLVALIVTLLAALLLAVAAPAADGPVTSTVSGSISPSRVGSPRNGVGTIVTLKLRTAFTHPADSRLQLQKLVYKLPSGATANGKLFPSCKASTLNRARGRLSACPSGSKIGSGIATGTAVDLDVTSTGRLTLFNGPGGRSITVNVSIINPAQINMTFSAPLRKTSGRFGYVVTANVPAGLQTILDGPIVVRRIELKTGATRVVRGVRRGYIEAFRCPRNGRAPLHGDFTFSQGVTTGANATIACS
jgi:hypothetical protein